MSKLSLPGARYPFSKLQLLWHSAVEKTGDQCFGLVVGTHIRPTSFHALGFSWLASHSLLESLERMCRYQQVITTIPLDVDITGSADDYVLALDFPDERFQLQPVVIDAFFVAILQLCRTATNDQFHPLSVRLTRKDFGRTDGYVKAFDAPVYFACERDELHFAKELMEARLPGHNIDLARANDRVLDRYVEALDPNQVASEVRKLLLTLLPTGHANQEQVAKQLNKSLSSLQRQLRAEGTTYREIRNETRKSLAQDYVREGKYSLSQIAYLLGFSDQSNFSRAFKRWTGATPGEYRA
jgi:AraC-like DNA-binding protein